MQPAQDTPTQW